MDNRTIKRHTVETLPKAADYSHAVSANGFIFLSGITGQRDTDTPLSEQFTEIVRRMTLVLSDAGATVEDVVKVTAYLTDQSYFKEFNSLFNSTFTSSPARTTVICKLTNSRVKVELDIIAFKS